MNYLCAETGTINECYRVSREYRVILREVRLVSGSVCEKIPKKMAEDLF